MVMRRDVDVREFDPRPLRTSRWYRQESHSPKAGAAMAGA